ncbi:MAG TPA: hypothetical protein VMD56_07955 [Steroidobacteraceae bacterium]|nr:hypothetical protein [Steroidobacteraceae bacterium]
MITFVIAAALLALLAVLFVILPLLRGRSSIPPAGAAAALVGIVLITVSAVLYAVLGDPAGVRLAAASQGDRDIPRLAREVEDRPDDFSAWLQLGGAYGASGQYPAALHAYQRANDLADGTSAAALSGMGESLLLAQGLQTGSAQTQRAAAFFDRALKIDPASPKGLYYSGLLAYQGGQLDLARKRFAALMTITPPPPLNVRAALQKMIDLIDTQMHPPVDAATEIRLHVSLAPRLASHVPANASLFVFVQAPGGGPPLAVKRTSTSLPQDVVLSADDAMIKQRAVQPGQKVTVVARISASGSPLPQPGDLYGQIEYIAGKTGPRPLQIDRLTPAGASGSPDGSAGPPDPPHPP